MFIKLSRKFCLRARKLLQLLKPLCGLAERDKFSGRIVRFHLRYQIIYVFKLQYLSTLHTSNSLANSWLDSPLVSSTILYTLDLRVFSISQENNKVFNSNLEKKTTFHYSKYKLLGCQSSCTSIESYVSISSLLLMKKQTSRNSRLYQQKWPRIHKRDIK